MNKKTNKVEAPQAKTLPMKRINSRIEKYQDIFIKKEKRKTGKSEGEILREILRKHIELEKKLEKN